MDEVHEFLTNLKYDCLLSESPVGCCRPKLLNPIDARETEKNEI